EAEQHYSAAGKDGADRDTRREALEGVERARNEAWFRGWFERIGEKLQDTTEKLDRFLGLPTRLIGIIGIISGLFILMYLAARRYARKEITQIRISQGSEAERPLLFAFTFAREKLRLLSQPPYAYLDPDVVDRVSRIFISGVDVDYPDAVKIGDFNVPLAALSRLIKPKVLVTTYWKIGGPDDGMARATIERKERGF